MTKKDEILVLIVPMGKASYPARIPNDERVMQRLLSGSLTSSIYNDSVFIQNVHAPFISSPNRFYNGNVIYGDFIISGYDDFGNYSDLSNSAIHEWYERFS